MNATRTYGTKTRISLCEAGVLSLKLVEKAYSSGGQVPASACEAETERGSAVE